MNTDTAIHNTLQRLAADMRDQPLAALLKDATRARGLVWQLDDLRVDLSRQYLNDSVMAHLQDFGDSRGLADKISALFAGCLLYTSPSPRDLSTSRMPSSA